jgi:hypothetical protein
MPIKGSPEEIHARQVQDDLFSLSETCEELLDQLVRDVAGRRFLRKGGGHEPICWRLAAEIENARRDLKALGEDLRLHWHRKMVEAGEI